MSEKNILEIKNLHVSADDKDILRGVDLTIGKNETHVLMRARNILKEKFKEAWL